jgi:hypothetical protein
VRLLDFWAKVDHIPFCEGIMAHPKPSAKNETGEYATFETALKKVLSVPRSTMKAKLDAEKRARKRHAKRVSSRASADKD